MRNEAAPADRPPVHHLVEGGRRLSESLLWKAQRRFFERQGADAWGNGPVPFHATSNPVLAKAYAQVALGFLRDLVAEGAVIDAARPFTVIELGAGSGRFAHLFLKAFRALLQHSTFAALPFRYVMTDFTERNLAFWRGHEALALFADVLDFARFDAERDDELRLERSGATLKAGSLALPPLVVANYVFDSLVQDAFSVRNGALGECRVSLYADSATLDLDDPATIGRLVCACSDHPLGSPPYPEPAFNAALDEYRRNLDDATFLFPVTALRALDRLAALAKDRLVLLAADRGEQCLEHLAIAGDLDMARHGSFSLPVNYHAIANHVARRGGAALEMASREPSLMVSAFLLGMGRSTETRLAFAGAMEHSGPDDIHVLRRGLSERLGEIGVGALLSLIRLSADDPRVLVECLPSFWSHADGLEEPARQEVVRVVEACWRNYYHLGESRDLPFDLALLLFRFKEPARALELLRQSRRLYGDHAATLWNIGLCHVALGDAGEAALSFAAATRLDPSFPPAGALQPKIVGTADAALRTS